MRAVNRGYANLSIRAFFPDKSVDPPTFLFKSETTNTYGKVHVNAIVTSDFAQTVRKTTCLMTIRKYNSNNRLTQEFK